MSGSPTSGYVADLPLRLSKKFYPMSSREQDWLRNRNIDCPFRFPADVLAEQYDFSAERKAMEDFQSNLRPTIRIVKSDRPQSEIESSVESDSSTTSSTSSSWSSIPASEETLHEMPATISNPIGSVSNIEPFRPTIALTTPVSTFRHATSTNGILQPVIAKTPATRSIIDHDRPGPSLRLEDFENVSCSPFDMVELKSINEIEELRRLWPSQQSNGCI